MSTACIIVRDTGPKFLASQVCGLLVLATTRAPV